MRLLVHISRAIGIASLAACSTTTMIPDALLGVSPTLSIPIEKIVYWGAYAGAAYLITDPLAPNWAIEATPLPDDHVHFSLHMKRYYAGGAGESRVIFHRKAKEVVSQGNYAGYQVIEYSEGLESSVLGSRRAAEGVIQLRRNAD